MPRKPCLDCGTLYSDGVDGRRGRCLNHARDHDRAREATRPSPQQRGYGEAWRNIRDPIIQTWREQHGDVCPGWGVPAHDVTPPNLLTGDHLVPKDQGGGDEPDNVIVLCKRCQGRKGTSTTPPR